MDDALGKDQIVRAWASRVPTVPSQERTCAADDCTNEPYYRKELCEMHLMRERRGTPINTPVRGTNLKRPDNEAAADAFIRDIYSTHGRDLRKYVSSKVDDRAEAEDAIQEVMLRAWRHADDLTGRDPSSVRAWLFIVAKRRIVDVYRQRVAGTLELPTDEILSELILARAPETLMLDPIEDWIASQPLVDALTKLSEAQRVAVVATALVGMTAEETGDLMGVAPATVRRNAFNGRARLYDLLKEW